ncbi:hypothetical protein L208DRAFT_1423066 [Tricholoma matsutake]|nr:hypothetical protein L208DRAFT_1423066 [Tricholoma matsutake 945]
MDLANLAINATPHFPFAEDEHLYTEDHIDMPITLVCTHQPVLQANARQPLPPPYGYHFPATPHSPHPIPQAFGPQYPPTPVKYGNPNQWSPHHDPGYFQVPQHIQHGQVIPHTHTVTPPPPSLPNISKHDHSLSPQKPKKHAHGGGPRSRGGQGSCGGQGAGRGGAEMEDWSTVDGKGNNTAHKIEIIEDDEYYLGPESDEIFKKLKNNVMYAHKKASKVLFKGKYSSEAIKGQYICAYDTFTYILALEGFTGGGGDGEENSDDDEDPMEKKISLARSHGVAIGDLTSKTYHKWQSNGWYNLFADWMGKTSKVTCPVVRNSCAPLSDAEPTVVDSESDNEESSHSGSKASSPNHQSQQSSKQKSSKPSKASKALKVNAGSQKVSELKHVGAKGFKEDSHNSLSALDQLVELKANAEEMKIKQMSLQQAGEEAQCKFDIAKQILAMDHVSDEVKVKANNLLFELMS